MNNKHSINTSDWDIQSSVKEIVLPVKLVWTKNFIFRTPDKNKKRFTFIPLHSLDIHQYGKNKEDITSLVNSIDNLDIVFVSFSPQDLTEEFFQFYK